MIYRHIWIAFSILKRNEIHNINEPCRHYAKINKSEDKYFIIWPTSVFKKLLPARGGENVELVFNGYSTSVGEGEKVLEMDSGDDCLTISRNFMPQNNILKNG